MVATSSKRRQTSAVQVSKDHLNLKSKVIMREKERIARMKAAREIYSKLSKERGLKGTKLDAKKTLTINVNGNNVESKENNFKCETTCSPARAFVFKPVDSSLDMIRNNRIKLPETGRVSSVAGARCPQPRLSLLPLGINVFDSKVSASDQQKVREFLSSRLTTGATPIKSTPSPFASKNNVQQFSLRSSRSVRFCVGNVIEEKRESSELEVSLSQEPSTSNRISNWKGKSGSSIYGKDKEEKKHFCSPTSSKSNDSQSFSPNSKKKGIDSAKNNFGHVNGRNLSAFVRSYIQLSNMSDEEWERVDPLMIDDLIECLQGRRERIKEKVCLTTTNSMESFLSFPDCHQLCHRKEIGFRKLPRKRISSTDLQANQEVMLINESAKNNCVSRRSLRLRLKDPVSSILGSDLPFVPIRERSPS